MASDKPGFLEELKRRHVVRVVIAYAVTAWLLLQLASIVLPTFGAPAWVLKALIALFVILFPVAVILAWAFEMTPEGVRRTEPAGSPEAREEHDTRAVGRKLNTGIIVALVIAVLLLLGNQFVWHRGMAPAGSAKSAATLATAPASSTAAKPTAAAQAIPAKSIAVLPFENLSNDKDNAYFASGIQDLILTKLADIGSLKVISRTSTEKYKSRPDSLKQVAAELGVATILEGSVQKQGNQVLINVQLIDAASDSHLWAQSYTRTLDNVFGVEGEVADKIASALNAKLSPAQAAQLAKAPTTNKAAYDAFLRAEYQANQYDINGDAASLKAAIGSYRQAVAADPAFALAFARLSYTESWLAFNWYGAGEDVQQLKRQARSDAGQALKLQPDLAAAQLALGYCDYWGERDYPAALKAFAAALAQRPNDTDALAAQGYVQRRMGHFDAAIASLSRAVALDPRHFRLTFELANTYMHVGRYADAEPWYQRALALEPGSVIAKTQYSSAILYGSGDIPRALAQVQGDAPGLKIQRAYLLLYQRRFAEAIALIESIPDTHDNFAPGSSKAGYLAGYYWQAGDKARAKAQAEKALPQDRAALAAARGLDRANLLNTVAFDEVEVGQTAAALAKLAASEAILAKGGDAVLVPSYVLSDAEVYGTAGHADLAVPLLAKALAMPGISEYYSPLMLWLDPGWDPIRHDPAFKALQAKYAKWKPAVIPAAPASTSAPAS